MAQSKFTLYKYIKLEDSSWRYCKAAFYSNGKIKPNRCVVDGKEEEHIWPRWSCRTRKCSTISCFAPVQKLFSKWPAIPNTSVQKSAS
jgi:hypothetical protein